MTTAKIKKNAVTSAKIKNGTVKGGDINIGTTPFGRVVAKLRTTGPLALTESIQSYPLNPGTYTQGGEEDDNYLGALDVTFQPTCEAPRVAIVIATLDAPNLESPGAEEKIIGIGLAIDEGAGTVTKRAEIGTIPFVFPSFSPPTSGITANSGAIDVIGTK